jgi:hypothetical protein
MFLRCAECGRTTAGWTLIGTDAPGSDVTVHRRSRRLDAGRLVAFIRAGRHLLLTRGPGVVNALLRHRPRIART